MIKLVALVLSLHDGIDALWGSHSCVGRASLKSRLIQGQRLKCHLKRQKIQGRMMI